jgi:cytochrome c biogenesis protein CcmG/thiol:disulfide interchange protein DsbE
MAMTRRHLLYFMPVLLFLVIGGFLFVGLSLDPKTIPSALITKPVPAFDLPALPGRDDGFSGGDLANGEVKLVNVFASWCVPCRIEHPILMRLAEDKTVSIYGINYKDKAESALAWLGELGNPFIRIGADFTGRVSIDWGVYGIPETFVVDGDGRIVCKHIGPIGNFDLENKLLPSIEAVKRGESGVC